jgi:hypothetical protein
MNTKLTLKLSSDVIERAHIYAKENNTSISRMVENMLREITSGSGSSQSAGISHQVKKIQGILKTNKRKK